MRQVDMKVALKISNIFCLQNQSQYNIRQQTVFRIAAERSVYHCSQSILHLGPKI